MAIQNEFFYLSGDGWLNTFSCPGATQVVTNSIYTSFPTASRNGIKMKVHDGYLYLATYAVGLTVPGQVCIFSLSNLAAPQLVSAATGPNGSGMSDVAVKENVLYVCGYFDRRIHAFDISDRQNPILVHTQSAQNHGDYALFEPWRMLVHQDALYVQDDNTWQIFNITTRTNPVFVSDFQVEKDIEGSRLVGNTLVWGASGVSGGAEGVLLFDCSDAFHPVLTCRTNLGDFSGYYWGDMDDNYIYQPMEDSVLILGRPQLAPSNRLTLTALPDGSLELKFLGLPQQYQQYYALEWTPQLGPAAVWLPLATNVVSYNGGLLFTNTPPGEVGFYRTKHILQ